MLSDIVVKGVSLSQLDRRTLAWVRLLLLVLWVERSGRKYLGGSASSEGVVSSKSGRWCPKNNREHLAAATVLHGFSEDSCVLETALQNLTFFMRDPEYTEPKNKP